MGHEVCGDNRFEIIANARARLIEATNIESSPDEMKVLDRLLFRMWQMGWLPGCRVCYPVIDMWEDGVGADAYCSYCANYWGEHKSADALLSMLSNYCPDCGREILWNEPIYAEPKEGEEHE